MTPLVKRLLILAVVVILGAAGAAFRTGLVLTVTNALGIPGRSAPKVAAAKPAPGQKPAVKPQVATTGPAAPSGAAKSNAAKSGAQPAPAPIQASAGLGISGPSSPGAPVAKPGTTPAKTTAPAAANSAAPIPAAAGLTPPSTKSAPGAPATATGGASKAAGAQRAGGPAAAPFIDPTERLSSWVREPYLYTSLGRRDPFGSLLNGEFVGDGEPGLVDVGNLKLVGIAWDQADRFAMVEDPRGFGYALREGDPVRGGRVLRINRTGVTFLQTMGGESNTITIELPTQALEGK
jgi:hypothetical protein